MRMPNTSSLKFFRATRKKQAQADGISCLTFFHKGQGLTPPTISMSSGPSEKDTKGQGTHGEPQLLTPRQSKITPPLTPRLLDVNRLFIKSGT